LTKKTVLRTIRIPEELDAILEMDAKEERMTVGGLIGSIFTKYAEWDRHAKKFGMVTLSDTLLISMLEVIDDAKLDELGAQLGAELPRGVMQFWFKKVNIEAFLGWMSLFSKYGGTIEYEIGVDGKEYVLSAHHQFGHKWSRFLAHFLQSAIRTNLGVVPKLETSEGAVVASFTLR
jgi:hypothetical protein